jgi:sortase A
VITVIGVVTVLFAVFAMWGTAVLQQRDQDRLRAELTQRFVVDRASADTGAEADGTVIAGSEFGGGTEADAEDEANAPEQLGPAGPGDALALLRIPEIGVDQVVVAGTGVEQLRKGPGHLRGTSRPGERGNVVIAGKRSTYGSPFGNLDMLRKGDKIELATAAGTYRYKVTEVSTVEPEKDSDVVGPAEENQLTLFTANPRYQAAERLVVVAELDDDQDGPPLVKVPPGFEPNSDELGLGRDSTAGAAVMLFGLLLALAGVGLVWARRRWTTWATWAVAAPVMVALGVLFFENLLRWFPSTV